MTDRDWRKWAVEQAVASGATGGNVGYEARNILHFVLNSDAFKSGIDAESVLATIERMTK